jgi:nucleoside-diphosphate-sugar epimerase
MANFLVAGGAGFIGSNIIEFLVNKGEPVRVVDDFSTGKRENLAPFLDKIELIEGDLSDTEVCARAVRDIDYVLHQAAVPSVPRSVANLILNHREGLCRTIAWYKSAGA